MAKQTQAMAKPVALTGNSANGLGAFWEDHKKIKVMKLEKLNSSKFEAFKEDELKDLFAIVGGKCVNTYGSQGKGNIPSDSLSDASSQDKKWTDPDGGRIWYADLDTTQICSVGQGEGQGGGPSKYYLYGDLGYGPEKFMVEDAIDLSFAPAD